jgi:hypothetical protein
MDKNKVVKLPGYSVLGLFIILCGEIGLILDLWFFQIFMTPICWTGLILFLDGINYKLSGCSLIKTNLHEFFWMLPWSIVLWYFFEFYNLFIKNWHYVGLPDQWWLRYLGYFWSFATIWPGVYEVFGLIRNLNIIKTVRIRKIHLSGEFLLIFFIFGLLCLISPLILPAKTSSYLAAPVWVGVVFLLDPLNYSWKQQSILCDLSRGNLSKLFQLFLAGLIAGLLWEFWNFWSTAKWIYTVPILGDVKIFEMPVIGYLGFPAFAVEIFVMWESVKYIMKIN